MLRYLCSKRCSPFQILPDFKLSPSLHYRFFVLFIGAIVPLVDTSLPLQQEAWDKSVPSMCPLWEHFCCNSRHNLPRQDRGINGCRHSHILKNAHWTYNGRRWFCNFPFLIASEEKTKQKTKHVKGPCKIKSRAILNITPKSTLELPGWGSSLGSIAQLQYHSSPESLVTSQD